MTPHTPETKHRYLDGPTPAIAVSQKHCARSRNRDLEPRESVGSVEYMEVSFHCGEQANRLSVSFPRTHTHSHSPPTERADYSVPFLIYFWGFFFFFLLSFFSFLSRGVSQSVGVIKEEREPFSLDLSRSLLNAYTHTSPTPRYILIHISPTDHRPDGPGRRPRCPP